MHERVLNQSRDFFSIILSIFGFFVLGPIRPELFLNEIVLKSSFAHQNTHQTLNFQRLPLKKAAQNLHAIFAISTDQGVEQLPDGQTENEFSSMAGRVKKATAKSNDVLLLGNKKKDNANLDGEIGIHDFETRSFETISQVEKMNFSSLIGRHLPQAESPMHVEDSISTIQAKEFWNTSLVSTRVNEVIKREMGRLPMVAKKNVVGPFTRIKEQNERTEKENGHKSQRASILMSLFGITLDPQQNEVILREVLADFIPAYSQNHEVIHGVNEGIFLENALPLHNFFVSGKILAKDFYPTNVTLHLEKGTLDQRIDIPLLGKSWLDKQIKNAEIEIIAPTSVLVAINDNGHIGPSKIDLDRTYAKQIFLDKDLSIVEEINKADFVLFLGVSPGNCLVTYFFENSNSSEITLVTENSINFISPLFNNNAEYTFELFLERPLIKGPIRLEMAESKMKNLTGDNRIFKKGLGRYLLSGDVRSKLSPQYFELGHNETQIYVGLRAGIEKVSVPDQNFIEHIMNQLGASDLQGLCLIQMNIPANLQLENIQIAGDSGRFGLAVSSYFLDHQGVISDVLEGEVNKIFILSHDQGAINLKLEFAQGLEQPVQSFCSPGTYLVEQI